MNQRPGRLVLLGHPVAHSLSPRFQNAALRAAGIPIAYEPLDVAPKDLDQVLESLRAIGAAGNVTIPHKEAVAAKCDDLTPVARRARAVNTFWFHAGRLTGDNTDVGGFRTAVSELCARPPRVVAVFGAGGAAAAALVAFEDGPPVEVRVYSRSPARTRALCERFAAVAIPVDRAAGAVRGTDLVVNTTPLGMADESMPVDPGELDEQAAVLDLVYRPGGTALVRAARARGLAASDGTTMLLEQGALAFERWFGIPPDRQVMREALSR